MCTELAYDMYHDRINSYSIPRGYTKFMLSPMGMKFELLMKKLNFKKQILFMF